MHQSGTERTRTVRFASGAVALAFCLVAIQIPIAFGAIKVEAVEGSAYGAYASIDLGLVQGSLGAVPSVALPRDGGELSKTAASVELIVGLTEFVDLDALEVYSTGSGVGGSEGDVRSVAVVDGTDILGGIIHADQVTATCTADSTGTAGTVTLVGASVAGVGPLQVSPAPNTGIAVPGVGVLVLNKQTKGSDGALTVNGLSLELLPAFGTGSVNIARAMCGLETSVASTPTTSPSSPSTTGQPSTTGPGAGATTTPGGSTIATAAGPTTTTSPDVWTTTTPGESTAVNSAANSTEVSDVANASYESQGNESGEESDGSNSEARKWPEHHWANSDRDTTVEGLMFVGTGRPTALGQPSIASNVVPDVMRTSPDWPTLVDLAILGGLVVAVGMLIGWRRLDPRRLIGRSPLGK